MNVVLCGYNWIGCRVLRHLVDAGHRVHVYTHESPWHVPDLAQYCRELAVPYTTTNISNVSLPFQPDAICSVYYRHLIKAHVIANVSGRIFNLHPSLLPLYRGCSSLTWALIEGQREAGFTYHYIDEGCDTGNIVLQQSVPIEDFDTQETLYLRVMFEAERRFPEALAMVMAGVKGKPQEGPSSYNRRGCPHGGEIDPAWPVDLQRRFVRAMIFPPYPPAQRSGRMIYKASDLDGAPRT